MKRRNRVQRQRRQSSRLKALDVFTRRDERKRRTWTFEQLEERNLFSATPLNVQTYSLSSNTPEGALQIQAREIEWLAYQKFAQEQVSTAPSSTAISFNQFLLSLPNDPYFLPNPTDPQQPSQWHLLNTGQQVGNPDYQVIYGRAGEDINVVPVWQGQGLERAYTGQGVVVAVIDSGVQMSHPDLAANVSPTLRLDALTGDSDPSPGIANPSNAHGTEVAGLIAAVGNNGEGGTGVAPGATIAPIRLVDTGINETAVIRAFRYAIDQIDITNNSWGPGNFTRQTNGNVIDLTPGMLQAIRDSIIFGRGGLGVIHVFASGNGGGPTNISPGFPTGGSYDTASYDGYVNSRYTIGVTGVDHDGLYANIDGTFTSYPEAGSSVLVAAPTGSNGILAIADDDGLGSGIVTTDLVGDNGSNMAPLPGGFELDRDFLANPDYTSRFNGTSASAPIVSGVIALMLEANPNLTWRDVQEILVRSARQNAQFEFPSSGAGGEVFNPDNTWQTNQNPLFQDPDPFKSAGPSGEGDPMEGLFRREEVYFPIADPTLGHVQGWTNGAGYTVSQGYGVYAELIGYGHGVVDAQLAVQLAENWHDLHQNKASELTFSTFVVSPGPNVLYNIPAAERGNDDSGNILVPGAIGGRSGFIDYWNEYFVEDDPESDDDGPFSGDNPPGNTRGFPFFEFTVPDVNAMTIESIDVKVDITGPAEDLTGLRMMLVSPEGMVSELNHWYADISFLTGVSLQGGVTGFFDLPPIDTDGGTFVWTFNTNRSWGERSSDALIIDPATGEPALLDDQTGLPASQGFGVGSKGWRFYIENWSNSEFGLGAFEIAFHGNPIQANTERVQGFVGVDEIDDGEFNYSRFNQSIFDRFDDPLTNRLGEVNHVLDLTQESFGANVLVSAYKVVNGVVQTQPDAQFITGHDGNYYFDLVPGEYEIVATKPDGTSLLLKDDSNPGHLPHYLSHWRINEDWFFAPDRESPDAITGALGEIKVDSNGVPVPFEDSFTQTFETGVRNINFLIDLGDVPANSAIVSGTVYSDLNGNGVLNGDDGPAAGFFVFQDVNRNHERDASETLIPINADGTYSILVPLNTIAGQNAVPQTVAVGILPPNPDWTATNPSNATNPSVGVQEVFAGPGDQFTNINFLFQPPGTAPDPGGNTPGSILGVVFNDRDDNGQRGAGEEGVAGFRVFVDTNVNGSYDMGEIQATTSANGSFFLANVPPGVVRVDVEVNSPWSLTTPALGYRSVVLNANGTATNVGFGIKNLATRDFGDLPASYGTTDAAGGAWHAVVPGFQMGASIDGEIDGLPSPNADGDDLAQADDDDGVVILTNGGKLEFGSNTLQVTLSGVGGLLNGWMDFNRNGTFDGNEQVFVNVDKNPGVYNLTVNVPAGADLFHSVAARFRWGKSSLGSGGGANIGEVEDYFLSTTHLVPVGDYNLNGTVGPEDLSVYQATFGSTFDLRADGNFNGVIDAADYVIWRKAYTGAGSGSGSSAMLVENSTPTSQNIGNSVPLGTKVYNPAAAPFINNMALMEAQKSILTSQSPKYAISSLGQNGGGNSTTTGGNGATFGGRTQVSVPSVSQSMIDIVTSGDAVATPAALPRVTGLFVPQASSTASTAHEIGDESSSGASVAAESNLLLLDLAWAQAVPVRNALEGLLVPSGSDDELHPSDLALAAVFDDELDWRPGF